MRRPAFIGLVLALALVFWPWETGAQPSPLHLLGQLSFESRRTFQDTTVGGLSGLAFDAKRNVYYAVSDDRGENQPPRFYTLQIDADASGIADVRIVGVTFLDSDAATPGIQPFQRGDSDLEDLELLADDTLILSSERDRDNKPWLRRFALDGTLLGEIPIPPRFMSVVEAGADGRPRVIRGMRNNLAFEGLALTPTQDTLFAVNEQALAQDGPPTSVDSGSNVRILRMERYGADYRPTSEYVYAVEKVFAASTDPNIPADNGVSAMVWIRHVLPQYDLLTLERAFATGVGNDVNVYGVQLEDATDVRDLDALPSPFTGRTARKTLLANVSALGVKPDNLESLALGPRLPNGHQTLILLSDDNFSAAGAPQINQFILLEIDAP
ncbi:MAG: esterase-like activity of phytase family protein [Chloroflexota bacterium]